MRARLGIWLLPLLAATMLTLGWGGEFRAHPDHDTHAAHDKLLRKGLVEAMKHGVALYNQPNRDVVGCIRVFEGTLLSLKPLLEHHKDLQKKIDDTLAASMAMPATYQRAFALRATLDEVNDRLRGKVASKEKDKKDVKVTDVPPKDEKKVEDLKKDKEEKKDEVKKDKEVKKEEVKKDKEEKKDEVKKDKEEKKDEVKKDEVKKDEVKKDKEEKKDEVKKDEVKKDEVKKDEVKKDKAAESKDKKDDSPKEKEFKDKKDDEPKDKVSKDKKDDSPKEKEFKDKKDEPKDPPANTGAIQGSVVYDGQLLSIGFVTLVGKDGRSFSANIQKDGTFALTRGKAIGKYAVTQGVPVGEYKVVIEKSTSPPAAGQKVMAIPAVYESAETTPLVVTVYRGKNAFEIHLKK